MSFGKKRSRSGSTVGSGNGRAFRCHTTRPRHRNKPDPGLQRLTARFGRSRHEEPQEQNVAVSYDKNWFIAEHFFDTVVQDRVSVLRPAVCCKRGCMDADDDPRPVAICGKTSRESDGARKTPVRSGAQQSCILKSPDTPASLLTDLELAFRPGFDNAP